MDCKLGPAVDFFLNFKVQSLDEIEREKSGVIC